MSFFNLYDANSPGLNAEDQGGNSDPASTTAPDPAIERQNYLRALQSQGGIIVKDDAGRSLGLFFNDQSSPDNVTDRRYLSDSMYQDGPVAAMIAVLDCGKWTATEIKAFFLAGER